MNSRKELFEQEKEKRRKEREEEAKGNKGGFQRDYEDIAYNPLDYEKTKIIRILGNPKSNRMGDPCSPKAVNISWILGDNDKYSRYIWPLKEDQPNWILWKIFNKVMSYKWDQTLKGGKGDRVYDNAEKHKAIFARIAKNNQDSSISSGWKPSLQVIINHIDRGDIEWHKINKHTKLLSKKGSYDEEKDSWTFEPGIPETFYKKIWDSIVEHYGDWNDYDIAVTKVKTGALPSDVDYTALHSSHIVEIPENLRKFIVEGPLTEEELSWERYDIDKLFRVSTYQKIRKNLGTFIKSVDSALGTKFTEELEKLVEEEKKILDELYGKEEKKEEEKSSTPEPKNEAPVSSEEKKLTRGVTKSVDKFDTNTLDKDFYKGISKLDQEFKNLILGKNADGSLQYDEKESGVIMQCSLCHFESPEVFPLCPRCSGEFN